MASQETTFTTEYKLVAPNPASFDWQHNVMRLQGVKNANPRAPKGKLESWEGPIKLNRKDHRKIIEEREKRQANLRHSQQSQSPSDPQSLEHGTSQQGTQQADSQNSQNKTSSSQNPSHNNRRSHFFKKKTSRIYQNNHTDPHAERLQHEERDPWLLEDVATDEQWTGKLDGYTADGSSGHVILLMEENSPGDSFTVLPMHRSYRFTQRPSYLVLGADHAEEEFARIQKANHTGMTRWEMRNAMLSNKKNTESNNTNRNPTNIKPNNNKMNARDRVAFNLQRLRMSDDTDNKSKVKKMDDDMWGSDEDDDEEKLYRPKNSTAQDEYDEIDDEEEFDDDDEGFVIGDETANKDEQKEIEDRLKRDMRSVNRTIWDEAVPDSDEDEDETRLDKGGKKAKKLLKKLRQQNQSNNDLEDNDDDDDDDDENPYLSEVPISDDDSSIDEDVSQSQKDSNVDKNGVKLSPTLSQRHKDRLKPLSTNSNNNSRPSSPSLAGSRTGSRSTSPTASMRSPSNSKRMSLTTASRSESPAPRSDLKRKSGGADAEDPGQNNSSTESISSKRHKQQQQQQLHGEGGDSIPKSDNWLITDDMMRNFIKTRGKASTRDILDHFKTHLRKDARNKAGLQAQLARVAHYDSANNTLTVD